MTTNGSSPATAGHSPGYTTNASLPQIAAWLKIARSICILTHAKPDGDATGSTLAVARALELAGASRAPDPVRAQASYVGPLPTWFPELTAPTRTRLVDSSGSPCDFEPDAVVVLDTGSWIQLDEVRAWLAHRTAKTVVIDHHKQGDPDTSTRRYVDTAAAAACQIAAELCTLILSLDTPRALPVSIAEPLYLGLMTDTGWFRHSNTTPAALRLAADLLEAGVEHSKLYELSEQRDRAGRLKIHARALASLELHHDSRVAIMSITKRDFDESGAAPGDSSGFAEDPLKIAAVQASVMLTEFPTGGKPGPDGVPGPLTKASMRSKNGPTAPDVNIICQKFGGGGHSRAAGAKLYLPLAEAKRRIIEAFK